jgi:hypothetical protein
MEEQFEEMLADLIPGHCQAALRWFVLEGRLPGNFLQAVLSNDLKNAVSMADEVNLPVLQKYVLFLFNYVPEPCWGSREKMHAWNKVGGYTGWQEAGFPKLEKTNELVK